MKRVLTIAAKDLRLRIRDRSAFVIGLVAPLVLSFIFNAVFGSALDDEAFAPKYGVVDEDGEEVAKAFTDIVEGIGEPFSIETGLTRTVAENGVAADEFDSVFIIPEGTTAAIESGKEASLLVIGNVDSPFSTQVATSIAQRFGAGVKAVQLSLATLAALGPGAITPKDVVAAQQSAGDLPLTLREQGALDRQLEPAAYFVSGMAVFFLFFTVQFGVSGLLEERQQGTLPRLLAAPLPRGAVIAAKGFTSLVLGVVSLAVLLVAAHFLMGADYGDPLGVAVLILIGVLAAVAIQGVVAAFARNAEQAGNIQGIVAVVLGMLGGSFFPVTSGFLEKLSLATPHAWILRGLTDLSAGDQLSAVVPSLLALTAITLVAGTIATFGMQRSLAP